METIITAVGPDNVGLADPIVHFVTGQGANIEEIQMYNHDEAALFAMLLRIVLPDRQVRRNCATPCGRSASTRICRFACGHRNCAPQRPRLAVWTTYRTEPPLALLRAIRDGQIQADLAVMIGNRPTCRGLAEQFGVEWHMAA